MHGVKVGQLGKISELSKKPMVQNQPTEILFYGVMSQADCSCPSPHGEGREIDVILLKRTTVCPADNRAGETATPG